MLTSLVIIISLERTVWFNIGNKPMGNIWIFRFFLINAGYDTVSHRSSIVFYMIFKIWRMKHSLLLISYVHGLPLRCIFFEREWMNDKHSSAVQVQSANLLFSLHYGLVINGLHRHVANYFVRCSHWVMQTWHPFCTIVYMEAPQWLSIYWREGTSSQNCKSQLYNEIHQMIYLDVMVFLKCHIGVVLVLFTTVHCIFPYVWSIC